MAQLQFEKAKEEQAGQIANLLNRAAKKLLQKNVPQWEATFQETEIAKEILLGHVWVASEGKEPQVVYFLRELQAVPWFEGKHNSNNFYMYSLAVDPDYQNKGLGVKVLNFVKQYAKDMGLTVYLDCYYKNEKLKNFYSENGFTMLGDYPEEEYFVSVFCFNCD